MEVSQKNQVSNQTARPAFKPFPTGGNYRRFGSRGENVSLLAGKDNCFGQRGHHGSRRREDPSRKDGFDSKLLDLSRVSHTRAGGRRLRFRAIIVSGDKAGKVGLGVASGSDVAQAVEKATAQSKKNMISVPTKNGTISQEVIAKAGPARIIIKPQRKGRGLMAGGVVRLLCQLAGIKDISSKVLGTTKNKLNNARATMKAFDYLRLHSAKNDLKDKREQAIKEDELAEKDLPIAKDSKSLK